MLRLNISQQYAKIEMHTVNPQLNLHTTNPQIQLSTEAAKLEISQPHGQLEIDQSPCRASLGLKGLAEFAQDNAERGRQTVLETIGRMSEEGDRMAGVEKEPDAIANIAADSVTVEPGDLEIVWIDKPIINYVEKLPEFNYTPGKIDLQLQRGTVETDFQRGTVNVGIGQYQSIKFWTTENKYDMYV